MSLVEKALQKFQAHHAKPAETNPPRGKTDEATAPHTPPPIPRAPVTAPTTLFVPQGPTVQLDLNALRNVRLLAPVEHERSVTRQLRAVKLSLLRKIVADPPASHGVSRTIMVTSGLPGDGKTFTSLNLAMSLAMEKDLSVVLVDADIPKRHLTSIFGLNSQRGLIDVLSDPDADVTEMVRATSVRNLYFVPVGRESDVATELLSSARMMNIVQRLAGLQSNLLVVFDSPPMLVTSEAQALAALMSQILLVVKAGTTLQATVRQTLDALQDVSGRVSLILNAARGADLSNYNYGYGYGPNTQAGPGA